MGIGKSVALALFTKKKQAETPAQPKKNRPHSFTPWCKKCGASVRLWGGVQCSGCGATGHEIVENWK